MVDGDDEFAAFIKDQLALKKRFKKAAEENNVPLKEEKSAADGDVKKKVTMINTMGSNEGSTDRATAAQKMTTRAKALPKVII